MKKVPPRILLALAMLAPMAFAGPADKNPKAPAPVNLVWPMPPDKPRIKYVGSIRGAADVLPVVKQGMLAKMAGLQVRQTYPSFSKPHGIATDSHQRLYISDSIQHTVFVLDREKRQVSMLGPHTPMHMPLGIAIDARDRIWVADGAGPHVLAFDADWNLRGVLGKPQEMENPTSVAVDVQRNRLYVVDSKKHAVLVYNTETGLYVTKFGKRGSQKGEFNFPTNVALDGEGRIYVADTLNRRVQIFTPDLNFADVFGEEGVGWGQFRKPKGIAVDEFHNVYVVDSDFGNFQIFGPDKQLLLFIGDLGSDPGQFFVPACIHIDSENYIYVADQDNHRVQIFKLLDGRSEEPQVKPAAVTPSNLVDQK